MLQFIAQYWLQFVFGLIITGLSIALKKVWSLYKKEQARQHDEEKEELLNEVQQRIDNQEKHVMEVIDQQHQEMVDADVKITDEINHIDETIHTLNGNIGKLTGGLLSIQRTTFVSTCKELLTPEHKITPDEYERLVQDHDVYNNLGGNNIGDKYFSLVEKKFALSVAE